MKNLKIILLLLISGILTTQAYGQSIDWISLSEAQNLAAEQNKKVLVFAEAEWCGYCRKMHKDVFPEQAVQDSLSKYFYPVRLDIESDKKIVFNEEEFTEESLSEEWRIFQVPTLIFLDSEGGVIGIQPGFLPSHIFDKLLAFVGDDLAETTTIEKYFEEHGVEIGQ